MFNCKKSALLVALLPVITLWTQTANAETLKTKNFLVKITRNCPEGYVTRHTKVQNTRSPFDGDWVYWTKRMGHYPGVSKAKATLLEKQNGKCSHCGLYFNETDIVEIDHIKPRNKGGKDTYNNLQLLHRHCHDEKSASDGSYSRFHEKDWVIEEPDEAKVSRPVL